MLDRGRGQNVQVGATARLNTIAFESKRVGRIFGNEVEHRAYFVQVGHVADVADIGRNFLLVIPPKGIIGVVDIVLTREKIDPLAPKLLDARDAAPDRLFIVAALCD